MLTPLLRGSRRKGQRVRAAVSEDGSPQPHSEWQHPRPREVRRVSQVPELGDLGRTAWAGERAVGAKGRPLTSLTPALRGDWAAAGLSGGEGSRGGIGSLLVCSSLEVAAPFVMQDTTVLKDGP